jgi:peptidoglycan/LPS O-acetylase OafA/YrhL
MIFIIPIYIIYAPQYLSVKNLIKHMFGFAGIQGLNHLWFISIILICYMITPLLIVLQNSKNYIIVFICTVIICEILFLKVAFINGAWVNCYVIGFLIGAIVKEKGMRIMGNMKLFLFVFILFAATNVYRIVISYKMNVFSSVSQEIIYYAHVFLALFIVLITFRLGNWGIEERIPIKMLFFTDKYSYCIYLTHHVFIIGPFSVLLAFDKVIGVPLAILLAFVTGVLLEKIGQKVDKALF